MRVLLIDDHTLFRSGLKFLLAGLNKQIEFEEADSCDRALQLADPETVELILMDFYMPGMQAFEALASIKAQFDCAVVVVSGEDNPQIIRDAIGGGASGFIPKASSPDVMVAALELILANGIYLPPHALGDVGAASSAGSSEQSDTPQAALEQLSKRQLQTLLMATQGKSNKAIARELFIAEGTVKAHLSACYQALGVKNRTEAVYATATVDISKLQQLVE